MNCAALEIIPELYSYHVDTMTGHRKYQIHLSSYTRFYVKRTFGGGHLGF